MGMTPEAYEAQGAALLPRGPAWPVSSDAPAGVLLASWALMLARLDSAVMQLIEEADPRTAYDLLADWERVAGLPDACELAFGGEQETGQRRSALLARITSFGGQTASYYIAVSAAMGYAITVEEFRPHTVDDDVEHAVMGDDWAHAWGVEAEATTVVDFSVDDDSDSPLAYWGNAILECVLERLKPAHSTVVYSYL